MYLTRMIVRALKEGRHVYRTPSVIAFDKAKRVMHVSADTHVRETAIGAAFIGYLERKAAGG